LFLLLEGFFKTSLTSATDVYDKKKNTQSGGGLSFWGSALLFIQQQSVTNPFLWRNPFRGNKA
jgi:hypothetical protein